MLQNFKPDPEQQKKIDYGYTLIVFLLSCIVSAVFVLTALPFMGVLERSPQSPVGVSEMPELFVLAILLAIIGLVLRKILPTVIKLKGADPVTTSLKAFTSSHLIQFVIFEMIAILGFVNVMLSAQKSAGLVYSALALICMVFCWPHKSQLLEFVGKSRS